MEVVAGGRFTNTEEISRVMKRNAALAASALKDTLLAAYNAFLNDLAALLTRIPRLLGVKEMLASRGNRALPNYTTKKERCGNEHQGE